MNNTDPSIDPRVFCLHWPPTNGLSISQPIDYYPSSPAIHPVSTHLAVHSSRPYSSAFSSLWALTTCLIPVAQNGSCAGELTDCSALSKCVLMKIWSAELASQHFSSTIAAVLITLLPKALIKLPPYFPWNGSTAVIDKEIKIWNSSLVAAASRYRTEKASCSHFCSIPELLTSAKCHQITWSILATQLLLKRKIIYGI